MRLFNWRRQAVLNAMPTLHPHQVRTPWSEFWRRLKRQPVAMIAGGFVLLLILLAVAAPGWPRLMRKTISITTGLTTARR